MSTDFSIKPVGAPVATPIAQPVSDAANKYLKRGKDVMGDVVDSAQNVVTAAKRVTTFG